MTANNRVAVDGGWSAKVPAACTTECTSAWTRTCTNPAKEGVGADCADDAVGGATGTDQCAATKDECEG